MQRVDADGRLPAVVEQEALQREADRDRQRRAPAEHDADQAVQDQVHARRHDAELDVNARRDEERGGQHADSRDFLLADPPHAPRAASRPESTTRRRARAEASDAIGDVDGQE